MIYKTFIQIAALAGALAVILGAFGAHALKEKLEVSQLQVFETGVKYQFYHSFALIFTALLIIKFPEKTLLHYSGWAFIIGVILFSGSLYLLSTKDLLGIASWKWLGPITPLGGLAFIVGWVCMLIAMFNK